MKSIQCEELLMTGFGKMLPVLSGLVCFGMLGIGGYFTLKLLIALFGSTDFRVSTSTALASIVVLFAAMIIASSIRQMSQQHKAPHLRAEKAATYQLCTDLWGHLLRHGHNVEERSPNTLSDELRALERLLLLYGSPGVLKAYAALRALERDSEAQDSRVRLQFATLLMEMRQDLGAETRGLTAEELRQLLFAETDRASTPAPASAYRDMRPRVSLAASSFGLQPG
jgi:hypothetical protein